jgi:hypothetical protein
VWCNYKSTVEATNMQKLISEKDCFVQAAAALDKKIVRDVKFFFFVAEYAYKTICLLLT